MNVVIAPFVNLLMAIYRLTGNLGWAVVLATIAIRGALLPLVWPSIKAAKDMQKIQPRLKKLAEKYGKDKEGLAKAQMELYKQEGINPLSGCLPQILQIGVLIIFYSAFNLVTKYSGGVEKLTELNSFLIAPLKASEEFRFQMQFLGTDLAMTPANIFAGGFNWGLFLPIILLAGSGLMQFWSAKMMMPGTGDKKTDSSAFVKATADKEDDMMAAMRTQSTYFMPIMTVVIGWNLSLGLLLYWFVNSALMVGQQLIVKKKA